ncbi:hypothetical protein C8Q80DRAFT_1191833 [Daedaleopsis nitida]|nr:hypothetical protein C8Q80DRAFT_1191833 [Daedaleopsis nitida]
MRSLIHGEFVHGLEYLYACVANPCCRCGKNYMASDPIVPLGGEFPVPAASPDPLLAFRCAPVIKPYLPEDASAPAAFLIDTHITFSTARACLRTYVPQEFGGDSSCALRL